MYGHEFAFMEEDTPEPAEARALQCMRFATVDAAAAFIGDMSFGEFAYNTAFLLHSLLSAEWNADEPLRALLNRTTPATQEPTRDEPLFWSALHTLPKDAWDCLIAFVRQHLPSFAVSHVVMTEDRTRALDPAVRPTASLVLARREHETQLRKTAAIGTSRALQNILHSFTNNLTLKSPSSPLSTATTPT